MGYLFAADLLVVCHLLFIVFVIVGGLIVLRRPRVAVLHIPACIWGAWISLSGGVCPLTPLENELRRRAGDPGYEGTFIGHYLMPILYPSGLTYGIRVILGLAVVSLTLVTYGLLWRRSRAARAQKDVGSGHAA